MPQNGSSAGLRIAYSFRLRNLQGGTMLNMHQGTVTCWEDNQNAEQTWAWQPVGDAGIITSKFVWKHIVATGEGEMVTMSDGPSDDKAAQWHRIDDDGSTWFENVKYRDCVLDLAAGYSHSGNNIYCWKSHGGNNQRWQLTTT